MSRCGAWHPFKGLRAKPKANSQKPKANSQKPIANG
jgi:hypothetical protein